MLKQVFLFCGNTSTNAVPFPSSLFAVIDLLCGSMMSRVIEVIETSAASSFINEKRCC